jgi:ribosomal protein S27AE
MQVKDGFCSEAQKKPNRTYARKRKKEVRIMKSCPECGGTLKINTHLNYVCLKCGGAYVPKKNHSGPESMFGVT